MNFQLRGRKFFIVVVLLSSFVILSLKIISSSLDKEGTLKHYFHRFIWLGDYDPSDTKKSIARTENFSASNLQKMIEWESVLSLRNHSWKNSTRTSTGAGVGCKLSSRRIKSWTRGIVTKVTPEIHANCSLLFKGDYIEETRVRLAYQTWSPEKHALKFAKLVKAHTCMDFKDELEDNFYTTKEEAEFPLAFAMLIHNNPFQVYRLLRVIYRPHNIYCIHYDSRSSEYLKLLFKKLTACFDNIIISSVIIEVEWGHHSLMDAQMNCFRDLLRRHHKYPWRYMITLCGKEVPLRTNKEMVQLLWPLEGSSAVRSFAMPESELVRFQKKWTLRKARSKLIQTKEDAGPIPYNLTIFKSMIYFALTPEFVNYTLNDEVAIALARFLKYALVPEESFYSTLFMIQGKQKFKPTLWWMLFEAYRLPADVGDHIGYLDGLWVNKVGIVVREAPQGNWTDLETVTVRKR